MDIFCWLFAYFAGTDPCVHGLESFDTKPDVLFVKMMQNGRESETCVKKGRILGCDAISQDLHQILVFKKFLNKFPNLISIKYFIIILFLICFHIFFWIRYS